MVALRIPQGNSKLTRKQIDEYTKFVGIYKKVEVHIANDASNVNNGADKESGLQSPIIKNIHDEALQAIIDRTEAQDGDLLFFGTQSQSRQRCDGGFTPKNWLRFRDDHL